MKAFSVVTNDSTTALAELEGSGRYREYISAVAQLTQPTERQTAGLSRALAFAGNINESENIIAEAKSRSMDSSSRAVLVLAEAAIHRYRDEWSAAKWKALRAFVLANRGVEKSLIADAQFALAFSFAELDRRFLALDIYRRIREDHQATEHRRRLAALNESWILWDMGRWKAVRQLLPLIPEAFVPRIELMVALVEGNRAHVTSILMTAPVTTMKAERRQLLLLLLESMFLRPELTVKPHPEWLAIAEETDAAEGKPFWGQALAAAVERTALDVSLVPAGMDWRSRLDRLFLIALSQIDQQPALTRELYQNQINPILSQQEISTPLIPPWEELELQTSAWGRILFQKLGSASDSTIVSGVRLSPDQLLIKLSNGEKFSLDLSRHAQSYQALKAIVGLEGHEVSKREIHDKLSGSRYAGYLHDDRIQKLYKRLENKIFQLTQQKLWCWPGNNGLRLLADILDG